MERKLKTQGTQAGPGAVRARCSDPSSWGLSRCTKTNCPYLKAAYKNSPVLKTFHITWAAQCYLLVLRSKVDRRENIQPEFLGVQEFLRDLEFLGLYIKASFFTYHVSDFESCWAPNCSCRPQYLQMHVQKLGTRICAGCLKMEPLTFMDNLGRVGKKCCLNNMDSE